MIFNKLPLFAVATFLLSACAAHRSIDNLYPEFAGKAVILNRQVYLVQVVVDNQINHPDFELLTSRPDDRFQGKVILLHEGAEVFVERFQSHSRFTDAGTELEGWTTVNGRKVKFYHQLNHAYDGVKKVSASSFPWRVKE